MVYVVQTQSGDSILRHIDQMRVRVGESVNMGEDQDTEDTTNFRRDGDQDLTTYSQGLPSDVAQNETEEEFLPRPPEDPQNSENTCDTVREPPSQENTVNVTTGLRRSSRTKASPEHDHSIDRTWAISYINSVGRCYVLVLLLLSLLLV